MTIPFVPRIDDQPHGVLAQLTPLVSRVIADNPSKFTYHGTGTYIVGTKNVVVIDPGPRLDSHREALETALRDKHVVGIVVTHCHSDHSPLADWLHLTTGAPRYAIGPHRTVDGYVEEDDFDPTEEQDERSEDERERETVDTAFVPDVVVADGETFMHTDDFSLGAVATPGHTSNHLCVHMDAENALFTGDHVMGWSTTVVTPPDGSMSDYMASLRKVADRRDSILWPTHGGPVTDPQPFLRAYLRHREEREEQIVAQIRGGNDTIPGIVKVLYADIPTRLHRPARRSVWAHLRKLCDEGRVCTADGGEPRLLARYAPTGR